MTTTLVNIRGLSEDGYDVYIGRLYDRRDHFGNPFRSRDLGSKAAAVLAFRRWLAGTAYQDVEPQRRLFILRNLDTLEHRRIGCHCTPYICHGDVYINIFEDGKCGVCNYYTIVCACRQ